MPSTGESLNPAPETPQSDVRELSCFDCGHVSGLVAARDDLQHEALTPVQPSEFLSDSDVPPGELAEELDAVLGQAGVRLYRLDLGEGDPPSATRSFVDQLAMENPEARPALVQTLQYTNHWSWAPGEPPIRLEQQAVNAVAQALAGEGLPIDPPDGQVIIIDTKLDDQLGLPHIDGDRRTVPAGEAPTHGSFVASLIRHMGPSVFCITPGVVHGKHDPACDANLVSALPEQVPLPSEIDILLAIIKAVNVRQDKGVLNLSFGTYPCSTHIAGAGIDDSAVAVEKPDQGMHVLLAALAHWWRKTDGAPVFAAAGNARVSVPFYPAAFPRVRAVSPVGPEQTQGRVVAWDDTKQPNRRDVPAMPTWVDHAAPGLNLISLGRNGQMFAWSGSSFASAIMAAWVASGNKGEPAFDAIGLVWANESGEVYVNP